VWLDAPVGYISSTANYCKEHGCSVDEYWRNNNSKIIHVIGKDIMYFHLLFWPAMLMESGFNLPDNVLVHGFLKVNGEKMSKSRGTFLTAKEMKEIVEPEHLRYYYASNLTRSVVDIDLDFDDFKKEINNELIANVFNFIYRTLSFLYKNFEGKIIKDNDSGILFEAKSLVDEIIKNYERYELRETVKQILKLSSLGNKYFQDNEPWKLIKEGSPESLNKAHTILSTCATIVKYLIASLKPIMPKHMEKIEQQLNLTGINFMDLSPFNEHKINKPEIIIRKIDDIKIGSDLSNNSFDNVQDKSPSKQNAMKEVAVKNKEKVTENKNNELSFDMLNLKVAKIISINDHPNADKLYLMKIDIGEERQLVAGLKAYYKKEDLLGKNIVVVSNMKPAKLRGYISNGMLLAGDHDGVVKVLEAPNSNPGDSVYIEGITPKNDEVTIDVVLGLGLKCRNKRAVWKDMVLKTDKEEIFVDLDEGNIR
jgi:methionyl-tRNA synthetase